MKELKQSIQILSHDCPSWKTICQIFMFSKKCILCWQRNLQQCNVKSEKSYK